MVSPLHHTLRRLAMLGLSLILGLTPGPLIAQTEDMVQRAQDDIARAQTAESALESVKNANPEAWNANPEFANRLTSAEARLAEARLRLQTGKSTDDLVELTRASALAMRAAQEYEAIRNDILSWSPPAPPSESEDQPEQIDETPSPEPDQSEPVEEKPAPKPQPRSPETEPSPVDDEPIVDTTEATLERLIVLPERETAESIPSAAAPPPRDNRRSDPGYRTPPPDLWAAANAFLGGDYRTTLGLLDQIDFQDSHALAQAYLFRAAARYSLYVLEGETDSEMLEEAVSDVVRSLDQDPELSPSKRAFSPRFIDFFESRR